VQASNGEVTLEGVVDVSLLYAVSPEETDWSAASGEDDGDDAYDDGPGAFMPREALHRALWLRELPFHGVVAVPGAASGGDVTPKVDVEEVKAYADGDGRTADRKSTRLNSSHVKISYAVCCLKNKQRQC